ncbi:Right handed beta helix region [Fibrobacter sp. UWB16]|uniref:right-handed parallel beta-helix repeat-containing protein n=1 Tax=Fibrobacter sp. UWB16 TaxID=1945874 RepID=UPI000BDB16F0|nr:right-handed parallel beta-helix repeat-containing protein [Fibrobacter sp. UWB16]SOD14476.1 Right handed beta helix region [Fibrobacter sp. UWB16]
MKNLICSSLVAVATIASVAFASGMPFPVAENNKVFLQEKDSPYVLEQSVVVGATDTLVIEPGVTVLMGEFAKLMIQGSVKIAGTNDKPVVFSGADSVANWNGFHIMSSAGAFEIKNLTVENAFRNTIFRSSGTLENVNFFNNYYGLWVDESPNVTLARCTFAHNRYALSVRAGRVVSNGTSISENVYGLYLETEGKLDGDTDLIRNNQESDIRSEAADLKTSKKRVRRNVWHNIEARF